jgi:predicted nucleotidyltransferase
MLDEPVVMDQDNLRLIDRGITVEDKSTTRSSMNSVVRNKLAQLVSICVRHDVRRLELFGSAAADRNFDPQTSDLDFLVEFRELEQGQHANAYFGLLEDLEDLFGSPVDLVMTKAIKNPYFKEAIAASRVVLYAA